MKERRGQDSEEGLKDIELMDIRENYAYSLSHGKSVHNTSTVGVTTSFNIGENLKTYNGINVRGFEVINISEGTGTYIRPMRK